MFIKIGELMTSSEVMEGYNFAYLDDQTKRMIRRAILKAVAIPGYQVPFGSREMPLPFGWGTGGIQVTASIIGKDDIIIGNKLYLIQNKHLPELLILGGIN